MAVIDIGIDMGTTSILVYSKGRGVIVKEPSVVAYDKDADRVKAIGEEARQMIGRTPGNITAIRPIRQGMITDYLLTERMLKYFLQKAMGKRAFRKPRIGLCLPQAVTEVEKKAMEEAAYQAGAKEVVLIGEPVAAAIGAGLDITLPFGNLVVDVGGGTTNAAVISLGDIVVSQTIKTAGNDFDGAITSYLRKHHDLFVGEQMAETIKIRIGGAYPRPQAVNMEVTGRNVITGLPKTIQLSSEEVRIAIQEPVQEIVDMIHKVLESTPPELAADIVERGIILTGGGALLDGLEELIAETTGINTMTAELPSHCIALGVGKYSEVMEELGKLW